jgi:hypothetical protein
MRRLRRSIGRLSALALVALAASCGGGGGGGGPPPPPPPPSPPSKAFVADSGFAAIGSSSNAMPSPGPVAVDRIIQGPNTMLTGWLFDLGLDAANDRLYVSDFLSILVFNNASTATGNIAPSRIVSMRTGGGPDLQYQGLYLDTVHDRLYVTVVPYFVYVFDNVSSLSHAAPSRIITTSIDASYLFDVAVDTTKDVLYVYGLGAGSLTQIAVYDNASTRSGSVSADRMITIGDSLGSGPAVGMFTDPAHDRLYAPRNGQVLVFDTASTRNGTVNTTAIPTRTITLPVSDMSHIFVELGADRLYAVDNRGINIIESASTVTGIPTGGLRVVAASGSAYQAIVVKP